MSAALTRLVENLDLPPSEAGEAITAYRVEVLREAADYLSPDYEPESGYDRGHAAAMDELRRMADGTP